MTAPKVKRLASRMKKRHILAHILVYFILIGLSFVYLYTNLYKVFNSQFYPEDQ